MPDNVELVTRVIDAMNRADLDAAVEPFSEDFEIDFSDSRGPMSGVYRGRGEAKEFLRSFFEPWASLEFDTEEIIELKDGRVLSASELRTRGNESGVEVTAKGATIWTVRAGEVAAVKLYQSKEEALEAVAS